MSPTGELLPADGGLGLRPRTWPALPVGAALFGLTVAFGFLVRSMGGHGPELSVVAALSRDRSAALTAAAMLIHRLFGPVGGVAILVLTGGWLVLRRRPLQAVVFTSVAAVGWLSSEVGKAIVARPRPPADLVGALVSETRPDSFPSGHTAFAYSLSLAVVLVLASTVRQRLAAAAAGVLLTCGVAASRVYLGVHYPSDTIGAVLAATAAVLVWLPVWSRVVEPRLTSTLARSRRRELATAAEPGAD